MPTLPIHRSAPGETERYQRELDAILRRMREVLRESAGRFELDMRVG